MKTKFTSIDQIAKLQTKERKANVTIKTKAGDSVEFSLKEVQPETYFKIKGIQEAGTVDKNNPASNFNTGIELASNCIVTDKKEASEEDIRTVVEFLKSSFYLTEISELITTAMDLCGLSDKVVKATEKN